MLKGTYKVIKKVNKSGVSKNGKDYSMDILTLFDNENLDKIDLLISRDSNIEVRNGQDAIVSVDVTPNGYNMNFSVVKVEYIK